MDQKVSQESDRLFREVFEHAPLAIEVTDAEGYIVACNPAYEELVGRSAFELRTMRFSDVSHPDDADLDWVLYHDLVEGRSVTYEVEKRLVHRDGRELAVQIQVSLIRDPDGAPAHAVGFIKDISAARKAQEARARFIADTAHELRGPVAALTGFAEVLGDQWRSLTDAQRGKAFASLKRQGGRLARLTNALLDLGRLDAERVVEVQAVRVADVVEAVLEDTPRPDAASVAVSVDPDIYAMADGPRLQQVLVNLLTNAYRYGGSNVTIACRETGSEVRISVADDGPGIPPSERERLFRPFARGEGVDPSQGAGLGLAIVASLTEGMHGRVEVSSVAPRGISFEIVLFRAPPRSRP